MGRFIYDCLPAFLHMGISSNAARGYHHGRIGAYFDAPKGICISRVNGWEVKIGQKIESVGRGGRPWPSNFAASLAFLRNRSADIACVSQVMSCAGLKNHT
jgi:hypothetical protein